MTVPSSTTLPPSTSPNWWDWEERTIVTEDAEDEAWQRLSTFSYKPNIDRYWDEHGLACTSPKPVVDCIAGCLRQARAYYAAAKASPLDIKPLLYYYGTTTLLSGISALILAQEPPITGHGMNLNNHLSPAKIGDVEVLPNPNASGGALSHFASCFSPGCALSRSGAWTLQELFSSIPDIKTDFELCYPNTPTFCHPVESARIRRVVAERLRRDNLRQAHGNETLVVPLIHRVNELYIPQ